MAYIPHRRVTSYLVTSSAALPVDLGDDALFARGLPQADQYQWTFQPIGGDLTLAGISELWIYDSDRNSWGRIDPNIGVVAEIVADGLWTPYLYDRGVDADLVAIVMPGVVDAGTAKITVVERHRSPAI